MSDCIAIRVLNERCDSCASAVLLCRCRSDSPGKTNQMRQKYSGLCGSGRMFRVNLTKVNRVSCI